MNRRTISSAIVIVSLAGIMFGWHWYWRPRRAALLDTGNHEGQRQSSAPSSVIPVGDFDSFQRELAKRVADKFGMQSGSVVIAPASYDLGWLLDSVETYPADRTDCVPSPPPDAIPAPHLFPSYQLSSSTAATMTLGSEAFQKITDASLDLSHRADLVYSIDHVQVLLMDLRTVDHLSHTGACALYLAQHPRTRIIRGLVTGKISFKFSNDNPASAQAELSKLGGVSAKTDPNNSTVTVADDQPSQILEILSVPIPSTVTRSTAVRKVVSQDGLKGDPWAHTNLLARKRWLKFPTDPVLNRGTNLDQLQAKNANDIRDVDARATASLEKAKDTAALADQHDTEAGNGSDQANKIAMTASARTDALHGTVQNLDQYQTVESMPVAFAKGRATLGPKGKADLDELADKLTNEKSYIIEVEDHSRNGAENSIAMADSVVRYLVTEKQVPVYRIYRSGIAPTKTTSATERDTNVSNGVRVTLLQNNLAKMDTPAVPSAETPNSNESPEGKISRPLAARRKSGTPNIFFQEDDRNSSGFDSSILTKFQMSWPEVHVETKVQRILGNTMPSTAQVRFFRAADEKLANMCRDRLKAGMGIDSRVVRIGLMAPAGQIEVWLPGIH